MPRLEPAALSEKEIAEIEKKIIWTGSGNILEGKYPVIEFPKSFPVFRIFEIFRYEDGNFEGGYIKIDFGPRRKIDPAKVFYKIGTYYNPEKYRYNR